jgi:hypothetical protein
MFYVSGERAKYLDNSDEGKYFSFKELLNAIAEGIGKWSRSYDVDRDKFEYFIDRYDRIISDKRITSIHYKNHL